MAMMHIKDISKLYLSGIEIILHNSSLYSLLNSKLYLSGIEIPDRQMASGESNSLQIVP